MKVGARTKDEEQEIVKRALAMLHGGRILAEPSRMDDFDIETQEKPMPTPETLAVSVLAENEPDEAGSILAIWEEAFGMTLDRERVAKHLEHLRQWQSRWVT